MSNVPARLPIASTALAEAKIDAGQWKVLVETTFPSARTPQAVLMALDYCRARKLDIFKKPVHIVPMWSSEKRDYVETVWPGISELRTTAFRTGQYAGIDEAVFGPMQTKVFRGKVKRKDGWEDREVTIEFPEWCQVFVHRLRDGAPFRFAGPKAYWLESYAKAGNSDLPTEMWIKRPRGQLEKVAEAAALRRAFPEEIGNDYSAEEMEGQVITEAPEAPAPPAPPANLPPPPPATQQAAAPRVAGPRDSTPYAEQKPAETAAPAQEGEDPEAVLQAFRDDLSSVDSSSGAEAVRKRWVKRVDKMHPDYQAEITAIWNEITGPIFDREEAEKKAAGDKTVADFGTELARCTMPGEVTECGERFKIEINQSTSDVRERCKDLFRKHMTRVQETVAKVEQDVRDAQKSDAVGPTPPPAAEGEGGSPEPAGPTPPTPPLDDAETSRLEQLLAEARSRALEGKKRLTFYFGRLTAEDRDLLRPHDKSLYAAAEAADAAAKPANE